VLSSNGGPTGDEVLTDVGRLLLSGHTVHAARDAAATTPMLTTAMTATLVPSVAWSEPRSSSSALV